MTNGILVIRESITNGMFPEEAFNYIVATEHGILRFELSVITRNEAGLRLYK
jgi:hypothetical protein